jgi:hypothetical protein
MSALQSSSIAVLRSVRRDDGVTYEMLWLWCPGCDCAHAITVRADEGFKGPVWKWDGNIDAPTVEPSIHCNANDPETSCHSFVRSGMIELLDDCGFHKLRGRHPLADVPTWLRD